MVKDLSLRNELLRKALHVIIGIVGLSVAVMLDSYGKYWLERMLFTGLMLALVFDHLRVEWQVPTYLFRFLQRAREHGRLHATTYALLAMLISAFVFDRQVAYAATAVFFFGDSVAAIVGRLFGKTKIIKHKSLEGSVAMLFISAIAAYWFTGSLIVALVMALVGTMVEALSDKIDDSLMIILFSGLAGQLVSLL